MSPNGLTVPDIKALVAAVSKPSDSPVKKKKEELLHQLYREPRYGRVKELAEDLQLTLTSRNENNADAAAALIALQAIDVQGPIAPM